LYRKIFRARKFLLADAIHHPAAARLCLHDRVLCRGPAIGAVDRPKWSDDGARLSLQYSFPARFADGRNVAIADAVLVRLHCSGDVDLRLGWFLAFAYRYWLL